MDGIAKMQDRDNLAAPKLRIGIMLNSLTVTRWVAKIVTDIQESSFAQVVLVVRNSSPGAALKKSWRQRLKTYWTHSLFERYRRWDRQRYRAELDAFEEVDLTGLLKNAPILSAQPIPKGFVDRFAPEDIARIREANLDVLFRFGFRIIRGEILSCAKHGVWSFHHADNREYRGAPPGFWEMYEGNPVTGSILQVLTESLDGGRVIYRSISATDFGSLYMSLNPLYWKTSEFAIRRLHDLYRYGWGYIQSFEVFGETDSYKKGIYRTPPAPVMLRFLARLALRKIYRRFRSLLFGERTQWFIAYRSRTNARSALTDRTGFRVVPSLRGRFYADPFLLKRNSKTYLFFEDFEFQRNRAAISYFEIDNQGRLSAPQRVLDNGYHMSYPFLFESQGTVYMIPETRARKTIELFRTTEFPRNWELVKTIAKDVLAVDSTVFEHLGKFWLFTNIAVPGGSTFDELHLFYSDSLEGDWTPHPKNPIVSDVRRARPAGALFFEGGKLLRPGQDCSLRYGYALTFNEIEVLSESDYKEKPYNRIEPDWCPGSICTHTYNRTEEFEVLDGMKLKRYPRLLMNRIRNGG
jgi:hypothetical protein